MQLLRVTDGGGTVSVGDIDVAVEPVEAVVSLAPVHSRQCSLQSEPCSEQALEKQSSPSLLDQFEI